jgi:hypothetical protein
MALARFLLLLVTQSMGVMMNKSELSQKQLDTFDKGFLYLDIATQFLQLIHDDLCRDDSLLAGESNVRRTGLMDGIACLMDDAQELITKAARGGDYE